MSHRRHAWIANIVFDLLIKVCGASESGYQRVDCIYFLASADSAEFRFGGKLGFGGKLWNDERLMRVTYYPEDQTPERDKAIERVNELLWLLDIALHEGTRCYCPHCMGSWAGALNDCEVCPRCFEPIDEAFLPGVLE